MGGIRDRRLQAGLSQKSLADTVGLSSTQVRRLERGLEDLSPAAAAELAEVLSCSAEDLMDEQRHHASTVVPGEGYTTGTAGDNAVFQRLHTVPGGRLRVLDLFCGAGGLSYGFEQTGEFATVCGVDLLPDRVETFRRNHRFAAAVAGDIRLTPTEKLRELCGQVDVIVGGPPCQGFSSIRPFRNLTEADPRNSLVEHYLLVVAALRPRWVVFENVVGLVRHEDGARLKGILSSLKELDYNASWRVVNAALFGVPQHRERVIIVGDRDGDEFVWPEPTHRTDYKGMAGSREEVIRTDPLFSRQLRPAVTVFDAISDLPAVGSGEEASRYELATTEYQREMRAESQALTMHKATRHSEKMLNIIRHSGENIFVLPPGMVTSGFSSCYSRLSGDRPSTTLTVNFVHPASNRCIHPTQDRALTPREGARIQSFPDHFEFAGTPAQIVKQIGNAVAPKVARALAQAIVATELKGQTARKAV